jgi:ribosome recycling factor
MVRLVHHKTEEARVAVRNVRRHAHDELRKAEKDGAISQDELRRSEEELQKLTDGHIAAIDAEGKRKEAELLEV